MTVRSASTPPSQRRAARPPRSAGARAAVIELHRDARDDAERALRADEELRELRPDGVPRDRHRVDDLAGRRDDAQRDEQILDLPVARGEHARAARGDVAADRRPLGRGGVVREGEPALVEQRLERAAVVAGLDGRGQRLLVDLDHAVHRAHVDHDRRRRAARPRPSRPSRRRAARPARRPRWRAAASRRRPRRVRARTTASGSAGAALLLGEHRRPRPVLARCARARAGSVETSATRPRRSSMKEVGSVTDASRSTRSRDQ